MDISFKYSASPVLREHLLILLFVIVCTSLQTHWFLLFTKQPSSCSLNVHEQDCPSIVACPPFCIFPIYESKEEENKTIWNNQPTNQADISDAQQVSWAQELSLSESTTKHSFGSDALNLKKYRVELRKSRHCKRKRVSNDDCQRDILSWRPAKRLLYLPVGLSGL